MTFWNFLSLKLNHIIQQTNLKNMHICRIHLIQFSESKNMKHNLNYIPNMPVSNPVSWMPGTISGMLMMQGIRDNKYLLTRDREKETWYNSLYYVVSTNWNFHASIACPRKVIDIRKSRHTTFVVYNWTSPRSRNEFSKVFQPSWSPGFES